MQYTRTSMAHDYVAIFPILCLFSQNPSTFNELSNCNDFILISTKPDLLFVDSF